MLLTHADRVDVFHLLVKISTDFANCFVVPYTSEFVLGIHCNVSASRIGVKNESGLHCWKFWALVGRVVLQ